MKKNALLFLLISCLLPNMLLGQIPQFGWAAKLGGTNFDYSNDMTIDSNGCTIQMGTFLGNMDADPGPGVYTLQSNGYQDIFIRKLAANGSLLWAYGIGNYYDETGICVRTDSSCNVYVLAGFQGSVDLDPGPGIFTVSTNLSYANWFMKLSPNGQFISAITMNTYAASFAIGPDLSICFCGIYEGTVDFDPGPGSYYLSTPASCMYVQKINTNFDLEWVDEFRLLTNTGFLKSLAIDTAGNTFVAGYFIGSIEVDPGPDTLILTSLGSSDIYIQKLDPQGNMLWTKQIGGTAEDHIEEICLGTDASINLTGYYAGTLDADPSTSVFNLVSNGYFDVFILKLTVMGNFIWARSLGNANGDFAYGIATDKENNTYITGSFWLTVDFDPGPPVQNLISSGAKDSFVLKLDSLGNFLWAFNLGGNDMDEGLGIVVDKNGNIYCHGYFSTSVDFNPGSSNFPLTSAGNTDVYILKLIGALDNSGTISGVVTYSNILSSAMDSTLVKIKKNGILLAQTVTNSQGEFMVSGISPGNLSIECATQKTSGGYNSLDGLLVLKHFVGLTTLNGLNLASANVDQTQMINALDALYIVSRFVGQISSFPLSDWVFSQPQIQLNPGGTVNCLVKALCRGDVNGSFTPY